MSSLKQVLEEFWNHHLEFLTQLFHRRRFGAKTRNVRAVRDPDLSFFVPEGVHDKLLQEREYSPLLSTRDERVPSRAMPCVTHVARAFKPMRMPERRTLPVQA